jgi:hypothetical protein
MDTNLWGVISSISIGVLPISSVTSKEEDLVLSKLDSISMTTYNLCSGVAENLY